MEIIRAWARAKGRRSGLGTAVEDYEIHKNRAVSLQADEQIRLNCRQSAIGATGSGLCWLLFVSEESEKCLLKS